MEAGGAGRGWYAHHETATLVRAIVRLLERSSDAPWVKLGHARRAALVEAAAEPARLRDSPVLEEPSVGFGEAARPRRRPCPAVRVARDVGVGRGGAPRAAEIGELRLLLRRRREPRRRHGEQQPAPALLLLRRLPPQLALALELVAPARRRGRPLLALSLSLAAARAANRDAWRRSARCSQSARWSLLSARGILGARAILARAAFATAACSAVFASAFAFAPAIASVVSATCAALICVGVALGRAVVRIAVGAIVLTRDRLKPRGDRGRCGASDIRSILGADGALDRTAIRAGQVSEHTDPGARERRRAHRVRLQRAERERHRAL